MQTNVHRLVLKCYQRYVNKSNIFIYIISYLPNPPLGQDMNQSQFLSGV